MTHQSLHPPQNAVRTEDTDRILRMFARFTSIGYIAYLMILWPSITELAPRMDPWWTPTTAVVVFGCGLAPGALSFRTDTQAMRTSAAVAATVFLVAVATWPAAWSGPDLPASDGVWLAAFPGLASLAAILAWSTPAAFVHLAIGCTGVQAINLVARDGAQVGMLVPEIAFAIMFCTLFVGGAAMALRTGRVLDATTDETYAAAADAAAQRARIVERERFDALIHDSVLSTLLAASQGQPHPLLRDLSETTLAELDDLRIGSEPAQPFSPEHALVHLRTAATDADAQARFEVIDTAAAPLSFLPAECCSRTGVGTVRGPAQLSPSRRPGCSANGHCDGDRLGHPDRGRRQRVRFRCFQRRTAPTRHHRQHPGPDARRPRRLGPRGHPPRRRHDSAPGVGIRMTHHDNDLEDVRELLGLRTTAAKTVVAAYVATFALVAWSTNPPGGGWFEFAAWIVVSVGAVGLVWVPGDPLPAPTTAYLTLSGPIAVNLIFAVAPVPIDGLLQLWPLAASTAIYTYMCVRGRTVWAWIGMATVLASCMLWAERTGQGAANGLSMSAINLAPLLMATFFAWTIRPAARDIFALRRQATVRVAAEAADTAVLDERDAQLTRLDDLARPLLERITKVDLLTSQERLDCHLLEAHLRDTLRAPALAVPHIAAEARAAPAHAASRSFCSTTTHSTPHPKKYESASSPPPRTHSTEHDPGHSRSGYSRPGETSS